MSTIFDDIEAVEQGEGSEEEQFKTLQRIINKGSGWSLQGSFGRSMMAAIEGGWCMLGTQGARDYWGNYIPSRHEVREGTKGSRSFVAKHAGEDWAKMMEEVQ